MELQTKLIDKLIAYWEWDILTGNEFWSSHFYGLLGFAPGEIVATYSEWENRLHPDDRERVLEAVKQSLENKLTYHIDYRLLCKNNHYKWVRAQGMVIFDDEDKPIRMGGTIEDVSDLYQQREMLEQTNQRMLIILEAVTDGYWDWDIINHTEYFSPKFKEMLGYQDHELANVPETWMELIHPEDLKQALSNFRKHCDDPSHPYYQEVRYQHKDGHLVHIMCKGVGLWNEEGEMIRMVGSHTDITPLKQVEERLLAANKEIREHAALAEDKAQQLEAANQQFRQFAYAASHDLQEPLRVIQGYARLINKMNLNIDQDANNYIQNMASGARRMEAMIDGLLIYSRIARDDSAFVDVDMGSVFHDTLKSLEQKIVENEAQVTADILPTVLGINSQLQQLLQNLISNAIKFRNPQTPPQIHISTAEQDDIYTFKICDNGIGIDSKQYDRVFELFKQLHPQGIYSGQGVGLALCKQIIERHGGRIWVESEPGVGTCFYFTLRKA